MTVVPLAHKWSTNGVLGRTYIADGALGHTWSDNSVLSRTRSGSGALGCVWNVIGIPES